MITLRVVPADEKHLAIRGIDPFIQQCLFELPEILRAREHPDVRERFFQDLQAGDPTGNAEWHKLMDDDLHHLFANAEEVVVRDLTGLSKSEVRLPIEHLTAWLTALNQARLVLAELHAITATDMEQLELQPGEPRHEALVKIHVLGYLLQLLVEHAA